MTDKLEQSRPGMGPHAPHPRTHTMKADRAAPQPNRPLRDMIQAAIDHDLRITEIIAEPDGTLRLLTDQADGAPMRDPLEEARLSRARKGNRLENRH